MASSTISNVLTTITPSAVPSNSESTKTPLTSKQVSIIIGSVTGGLLVLLLFLLIALRLWRQRKYDEEPPDDNPKCLDAVESQESIASKPPKLPMFKFAEADPLTTATTESRQLKGAYTRPSSSVNKKHYAGLATHETHTVSLDIARSPVDDVESETATLRRYQPTSSKSAIKLTPAGVVTHKAPSVSLDIAQYPLGFETAPLRPHRPISSKSNIKLTPAGVATQQTHTVSLNIAQSPIDDVGFDTATLLPYRPRSNSKSKIKLPPLIIPENIPLNVNEDSLTQTSRTKSIKQPDSGWELESNDSASLYSEASASLSISSMETIRPPPVPPIPLRFGLPTQSTLPKGAARSPRPDEDNKSLPPLPSFKFLGDNGEEDETQIYNVAKLLQSRQSKLPQVPKDAMSRNASLVSHIERSGSISVVITPEESYRPRYYRLKQKRDREDSLFSSNLSTHMSMSDSLSMLSTPRHSLAPPSLGS